MLLRKDQLDRFGRDGFLMLPGLFPAVEVSVLRRALSRVLEQDSPANIREKNSQQVRTALGLHQRDRVFGKLARHPRLVEPAQQIAGPDLYIQQVKINVKAAFTGEAWHWHQDFATHHLDDGVPEPLALNLHVFIDEVTEFNGPLYFIRGSHRFGPVASSHDTVSTGYPLRVIEPGAMSSLAKLGRPVSATGPAGTALIFGDLLAHASPPNRSPSRRAIFSLILNPVSNRYTRNTRADHYHHRELTPVRALNDDCLVDDREQTPVLVGTRQASAHSNTGKGLPSTEEGLRLHARSIP